MLQWCGCVFQSLDAVRSHVPGQPGEIGLSASEKRRLSIAMELAACPQVLAIGRLGDRMRRATVM